MITGNETGKKVYAHTARLAADLTRMGRKAEGNSLLLKTKPQGGGVEF